MKRWIGIIVLVFVSIGVGVYSLGTSTGVLRWALTRPQIAEVFSAAPRDIDGTLFGPIRIRAARVTTASLDATIQGLVVTWNPWDLLTQQVTVEELSVASLALEPKPSPSTKDDRPFELPITVVLETLRIQELVLENLQSPYRVWSAEGGVSLQDHYLGIETVRLSGQPGRLIANGQLALTPTGSFDLTLSFESDQLPLAISGAATLSGVMDAIRVDLAVNGDLVGTTDGIIDGVTRNAALTIQVSDIASHLLPNPSLAGIAWSSDVEATPERLVAKGQVMLPALTDRPLALVGSGDWATDIVSVVASLSNHSEAQIDLIAEGDKQSGRIKADLSWTAVGWPLDAPTWHSQEGRLSVAGRQDALAASGQGDLRRLDLPAWDTEWQLNLVGKQISLDSLLAASEGQTLEVQGSIDADSLNGSLTATLTEFNPSTIVDAPAGRLSGQMNASRQGDNFTINVDELDGELAGQPASATLKATGELEDGSITRIDTAGNSVWGESQLNFEGGLAENWALALTLQSDGPPMEGADYERLEAAGRLSGPRLNPALDLQVSATALNVGRVTLPGVQLSIGGTVANTLFKGNVRDLSIDTGLEQLETSKPAAVEIAQDGGSISPLCLVGESANLCASATVMPNGFQAELDVTRIDLSVLDRFSLGLTAAGSLSGAGVVTRRDNTITGEGRFIASQGAVTTSGTEQEKILTWQGATLTFSSIGATTSGKADVDLGQDGFLRADLETSNGGELLGSLKAETSQLQSLGLLVPELTDMTGRLSATAELTGTWSDPVVIGRADLQDASLGMIDLGIRLRDGRARVDFDRDNIELSAEASSGAGRLSLDAKITGFDPIALNGTVRGSQFLLADLPEAELTTNLDLDFEIENRHANIGGTIEVPVGTLSAPPQATVATSADERIIGELESPDSGPPWTFGGHLTVSLGPELKVNGSGVKGSVAGDLKVTVPTTGTATGRGEINLVNGTYSVFRQELTIDRGALLFSGGTLDNPGLDVRASRTVGEQVVGVLARGPISEPTIILFSEPPLSSADNLSYLTFGKAVTTLDEGEQSLVNQAAGSLAVGGGNLVANQLGRRLGFDETSIEGNLDNASLVLGKYLSPRLYVSYGIGLVEAVETLRLRYTLSRRWLLQAESGLSESVDLLYAIEH